MVQFSLTALLAAGLSLSSCKSGPKDADIQTSFNDKMRADASMANISGTVKEGIVTLTGQCPDEACKTGAESSAKGVTGVKSVVNNIMVMPPVVQSSPVTVDADASIRTSTDAIVKKYPGVTADVQGGKVILRGTVKSRDEMQKVLMAVNDANIKNFDNQLTVKQ